MVSFIFYIFAFLLCFSSLMVVFSRNSVHSVLFLIFSFFNAAGLFILLGAELLAMLLVIVYVGAVAVLFLFVVMMLDIRPQRLTAVVSKEMIRRGMLRLWDLLRYLVVFSVVFSGFVFAFSYTLDFASSLKGSSVPLLIHSIPVVVASFFYEVSLPPLAMPLSFAVVVLSFLCARLVVLKIFHTLFVDIVVEGLLSFPAVIMIGAFLFGLLFKTLKGWSPSSLSQVLMLAPASPSGKQPNTQALGQIIYTDYMLIFEISAVILLVAMIGAIVLTLRRRENFKRQDAARQIARKREDSVSLKKIPLRGGLE
jgi:NADH:ubiquinone oxidoreductase subunit 6 (subunit J)